MKQLSSGYEIGFMFTFCLMVAGYYFMMVRYLFRNILRHPGRKQQKSHLVRPIVAGFTKFRLRGIENSGQHNVLDGNMLNLPATVALKDLYEQFHVILY